MYYCLNCYSTRLAFKATAYQDDAGNFGDDTMVHDFAKCEHCGLEQDPPWVECQGSERGPDAVARIKREAQRPRRMTTQEYVENSGACCPVCHSTNIEGGAIDIEGRSAVQPVGCVDCGSSWTDQFQLASYENLEVGTTTTEGA